MAASARPIFIVCPNPSQADSHDPASIIAGDHSDGTA
jgi:hypothetical protein